MGTDYEITASSNPTEVPVGTQITLDPVTIAPTYTLTVTNGSGDGDYEEGTAVVIVADPPPAGQVFDGWSIVSGPGSFSGSQTSETSEWTTGGADAELIANYVAAPTYTLTVTGGTGDGNYVEGAEVQVVADPPAQGMQFKDWNLVSGSVDLANPDASTTTATILAFDATIEATYEVAPPPGSGWEVSVDVNELQDVMPTWSDPITSGNPKNVTRAYSGACWDDARRRYFVWGGGHGDCSDNGIYRFDFPVRTWAVHSPTTDRLGDTYNSSDATLMHDGKSWASHSRGNIVFNPVLDRIVIAGPADLWTESHSSPHTFGVHPETGAWERYDDVTVGGRGTAAVDAAGNTYLVAENEAQFGVMNTSGNWTYYPVNGFPVIHHQNMGTVDTDRNVFVVYSNGRIWEADLTNLPGGLNDVRAANFGSPEGPGCTHVPGLGVVFWTGGEPWVYDGVTQTQLQATAPAPTPLNNGTYGRLAHDSTDNVLLVVNEINDPVSIYRL